MGEDLVNPAGPDGPKVIQQVVISLLDNDTTQIHYTCDEIQARGLLCKGRAALDFQTWDAIQQARSSIIAPPMGRHPLDGFHGGTVDPNHIPGIRDIRL